MLTLDSNTLFYWDLSNNSKRPKYEGSVVSQWARAIPNNAKPGSRASTTSKHSSANHSAVPSMTNRSTITATSIRTSQTQKHPSPPRIYIKPEPQDDVAMSGIQVLQNDDGQLFVQDEEVISDRDEMSGKEHEDAVKSPPKAVGVRLGSEVSFQFDKMI